MRPAFDRLRRARPLLGTFVEIDAAGAPRAELDAAVEAAFQAVAHVHRLMSVHEAESDVGRLNREASTQVVSVRPWTYDVLRVALELHDASGGVFDIAIAPVLQRRGLLPSAGNDQRAGSTPAPGFQTVELLPGHGVRFARLGVTIDLGGIAKGFAVDRALNILRDAGVPRGLVNAGGDLAAFGPDAYAIHLRDPRNPRFVICRVDVQNEALASSGGHFDPFRSSGVGPAAVIDPSTQEPARTVQGATVRAPSCMVADALTKVVMILGERAAALLARYGAHAMLIPADGSLRVTGDWQGAIRRAS